MQQYDAFETCFAKLTPPKNVIFSNSSKPCRYESPLRPLSTPREACPFRSYCEVIATDADGNRPGRLEEVLAESYLEPIKSILAEPSTSVVIRSEQQFHGEDLFRYAQRRHLIEVVGNGTPGDVSRFGVECTPLEKQDRLGEYLGFVDLRQRFTKSPLAFGLLVEPSWIREDPSTFVIRGDYGPLFGAHSFRSTVYAMQDKTAGAKCAQMCIIMAVGMLADRGAQMVGSFTLTYLNWKLGRTAAAVASTGGSPVKPIGTLKVTGLKLKSIAMLLEKAECRARETWIRLDSSAKRRFAERFIEAYVYARFPVIVGVDQRAWAGSSEDDDEGDVEHSNGTPIVAHAVTVVGVRRQPAGDGVKAFIVHDPGSQPFAEAKPDRLFNAASSCPEVDGHFVPIVAAADKSISYHLNGCIYWLRKVDEAATFQPYDDADDGTDYRIRLLNRNTLCPYLKLFCRANNDEDFVRSLAEFCTKLKDSRFWVVIGLQSFQESGNGQSTRPLLNHAWIFDARPEQGQVGPVLTLSRNVQGMLGIP
jgi:hypothetical protein